MCVCVCGWEGRGKEIWLRQACASVFKHTASPVNVQALPISQHSSTLTVVIHVLVHSVCAGFNSVRFVSFVPVSTVSSWPYPV